MEWTKIKRSAIELDAVDAVVGFVAIDALPQVRVKTTAVNKGLFGSWC